MNKFIISFTEAKKSFKGSPELFTACWSQYKGLLDHAIDYPTDQKEVNDWLDKLAIVKVNDPKSKFYIHG